MRASESVKSFNSHRSERNMSSSRNKHDSKFKSAQRIGRGTIPNSLRTVKENPDETRNEQLHGRLKPKHVIATRLSTMIKDASDRAVSSTRRMREQSKELENRHTKSFSSNSQWQVLEKNNRNVDQGSSKRKKLVNPLQFAERKLRVMNDKESRVFKMWDP